MHDTQHAQISQKQDGRNIYAIMKTVCHFGYHNNDLVATHAFGYVIYGCMLLVPMNVKSAQVISDPRHTECTNSKIQDGCKIYKIMRKMCQHGYHHSGFVITHALWHLMQGYTLLLSKNKRVLNKLCKESPSYAHLDSVRF